MLTELKLSLVSFTTALVINYRLIQASNLSSEALLSLQPPESLTDLPLTRLVKPLEMFVMLLIPGHRRLIRFDGW